MRLRQLNEGAIHMSAQEDPRRGIPSISELLESDGARELIGRYSRGPVVGALRAVADELRKAGMAAAWSWPWCLVPTNSSP